MKRTVLSIVLVLFLSPLIPGSVFAGMRGDRPMHPYGGYCRGPQWGWYGAQRSVNTVEKLRTTLEEFLRGTNLTIGRIVERPTFYEADILDTQSVVVDTLIVDKRTGRIRSKY